MTNRKDIILDNNFDLMISNGDFYISNSDQQNIELILLSYPGQWKQFPLLGAAIQGDINGPFNDQMKNRIKKQLISDGYGNVDFLFDIQTSNIKIKIN
jgi:hypothetical protein